MKIIGWIREHDKAECGGTVIDADQHCMSMGLAYTFEGARMACPKNCVIAEGYAHATLTNRRSRVIHGMKTSGGCPLLSTLNDRDGIGNSFGAEVPIRFVRNEAGGWVGKTDEGYDQHFQLIDKHTGAPLTNRHYRITFNGNVIQGKTDADGRTAIAAADAPAEVSIEIMPEGYLGIAK